MGAVFEPHQNSSRTPTSDSISRTISMYQALIPVSIRTLNNLTNILEKGSAYAGGKPKYVANGTRCKVL
jgi:hypothetical protein